MITPPYLKVGDKIAITCPAKKLPHDLKDAVNLLTSWGLEVVLGETVNSSFYQFAGTDDLRAGDFQRFLDDDSVKAIIAARGGYGTVRIIDKIDFSTFKKNPKWIVGFSDITVLHAHIHANFEVATIHGQMPLSIPDGTKKSLETLRRALFGEELSYNLPGESHNLTGRTEGILIGGNLTLLVMLSGSVSDLNYEGNILFIEDVGEYLYNIDRMLWCLKRAKKLAKLKGLIVGGFSDMKDNEDPFGKTAFEIIKEHINEYNYPVCFNFPAGHISDNNSLILGKRVSLKVEEFKTLLRFNN